MPTTHYVVTIKNYDGEFRKLIIAAPTPLKAKEYAFVQLKKGEEIIRCGIGFCRMVYGTNSKTN